MHFLVGHTHVCSWSSRGTAGAACAMLLLRYGPLHPDSVKAFSLCLLCKSVANVGRHRVQLLSTPPNGNNTSLVPTRVESRLHSRESNEAPSQLGSSSPDSRQPLKVPTGFSKISPKFLFTVSTRVVRPGIFDIAVWTADVTAWLTAAIRDCAVKDTSTDAPIPRKCICVPFCDLEPNSVSHVANVSVSNKRKTNMCTNRLQKKRDVR